MWARARGPEVGDQMGSGGATRCPGSAQWCSAQCVFCM